MAEEYSEVWVTVHCGKDAEPFVEGLNEAWREILENYSEYGIVSDIGSIVGIGESNLGLQIDHNRIQFGLGAHAEGTNPNYVKQYQAIGEMIWKIQHEMVDWGIDIELLKTGASG